MSNRSSVWAASSCVVRSGRGPRYHQSVPHPTAHYPQFLDTLRCQLTTRAEFERLVATDPGTLTGLERVGRFLYLQRTAFGGKVSGRRFGVSKDRPGRFNLTTLEPILAALNSRLSGVVIECMDWATFIPKYDVPDTLIYVDPP